MGNLGTNYVLVGIAIATVLGVFAITNTGITSVTTTSYDGLVGDAVANAPAYFTPWYLPLAVAGGDAVNRRSLADEVIRGELEDCIDCYSFLRNAYLSHRQAQIEGRDSSEHLGDDLYDDPGASDDRYEDPEALDEGYE